ncbi:MAG: hypothetical protein UT39_C0009G0057 [Candidatus Woesebacteria bacterium GW2011_GWA1_39_21]|uniref:Uncharacterized protein n=1 Tax=Candidatus Woesebacteria bacterium GW2011_GWA1_39_21 TaxID=1618550 RepID=A0A0G0RC74_9BACT|nr:MAG: hypothetical protein UT39_C0009G0057 [Candidatus Woesebacteria bacterium GW2011_GWA1_39_21]
MIKYCLHLDLAGWRSGNAAVCKTAMQGFDSPSGLKKTSSLDFRLNSIGVGDGELLFNFKPLL